MLRDIRPILGALARFFIVYFGMIGIYQWYLMENSNLILDPISRSIAKQVAYLLNGMGYETLLVDGKTQLEGIYFYIREIWAVRMVEGCNAISVIILYLAFFSVFYKGIKTFFFACSGLLLLYVANLTRICLLCIVAVDYPEHMKIVHDYFFPAIIYGSMLVLWLVWVKCFALKK